MIESEQNYQQVYFAYQNSQGCAINLISFGYYQFIQTRKVEKIDILKELCENNSRSTIPNLEVISDFALNQLIDCIKITICFENFMKALLLLNGYVLHKIDKNIFPTLYKEQFSRPITLKEILKISKWEINERIVSKEQGFKKQIKGILKNTIGMNELLSRGYQKTLNFSPEILKICNPYFKYRNNLHLYVSETFTVSKKEYNEFIKIVEFINENLIRIHNILIDDLGKGDKYKLEKIKFSA